MRSTLSFGIVLSALGVVLAASPVAYAQVDCSDPDNLCTGDPCVIPAMEVQEDCDVDFGARTVVVAGRLRALTNLFITAAQVDVEAPITALYRLVLTTTGDINVRARIRAGIHFDSGVKADGSCPLFTELKCPLVADIIPLPRCLTTWALPRLASGVSPAGPPYVFP